MTNVRPVGGGHDPLRFLPCVEEQLAFYVYALRDPRNNEIFYVGKGSGSRAYAHAREARKVDASRTRRELKLDRIREIREDNVEVGVEILRFGLRADMAFEVEAAVIDALRLAATPLTNVVAGHGAAVRGWRPLKELIATLVAKRIDIAPTDRVLLINISREYSPDLSDHELYERTRKWWRVAPHGRRPDYAFAIYRGIVRAVFRIDTWEKWTEDSHGPAPEEWEKRNIGRWAFHGERDYEIEDRYFWGDVSHYLPNPQTTIRYVNC